MTTITIKGAGSRIEVLELSKEQLVSLLGTSQKNRRALVESFDEEQTVLDQHGLATIDVYADEELQVTIPSINDTAASKTLRPCASGTGYVLTVTSEGGTWTIEAPGEFNPSLVDVATTNISLPGGWERSLAHCTYAGETGDETSGWAASIEAYLILPNGHFQELYVEQA